LPWGLYLTAFFCFIIQSKLFTTQQQSSPKGITYSVLSASWDDDREGSTFGADEFSKNVESLREGLSRTKENALLRERMAGMSEEEIRRAMENDK
jgi:hypothetical protein